MMQVKRQTLIRVVRTALAASTVAVASACGSGAVASNQPSSAPANSPALSSAAAASVPAASVRPFALAIAQSGPHGPYLTDSSGMALYTFDNDSTVSACNGECIVTWPPFIVATGETAKPAAGVSGAVSTGERADGSLQVAYKGELLYFYSGDLAAGDTKGDGVGGVWHLAQP
jgi:predicted lipoprotein with Yx(FWY)xxD motif